MTLTDDDLRAYFRSPELDRSALGREIEHFVRDEFGMIVGDALGGYHRPELASFSFCIDDSGKNVDAKPFEDGVHQWLWRFAVSCRAPLISCRTYTVGPLIERGERRPGTFRDLDDPPRPEAVEWTQRVARQFALTYVDARPLMEWVVPDNELPPDIEDSLNYVPDFPNAFLVLFLQY